MKLASYESVFKHELNYAKLLWYITYKFWVVCAPHIERKGRRICLKCNIFGRNIINENRMETKMQPIISILHHQKPTSHRDP